MESGTGELSGMCQLQFLLRQEAAWNSFSCRDVTNERLICKKSQPHSCFRCWEAVVKDHQKQAAVQHNPEGRFYAIKCLPAQKVTRGHSLYSLEDNEPLTMKLPRIRKGIEQERIASTVLLSLLLAVCCCVCFAPLRVVHFFVCLFVCFSFGSTYTVVSLCYTSDPTLEEKKKNSPHRQSNKVFNHSSRAWIKNK